MKLQKLAGATSEIWQIFISDSSSTTGNGLTGLTNASSGLTAYYHRDTDTTATQVSLVTMTVGTFTSSGFKEIDSTNMPGWYQFCPPNAALASGAKSCAFLLRGATNMVPLPIEVQLTTVNPDNANYGLTNLDAAVSSRMATFTLPTNFSSLAITAGGAVTVGTNNDKTGYSLTQAFPTNFSSLSIDASGRVDLGKWIGVAPNALISGRVDASVGVNNDKTGYSLTQTFPTNFSSLAITAGGAVTVGTNNDKTGYSLAAADSPVNDSGTAQAGAASTITLRSGASATDSIYNGQTVKITSGTGVGQARVIAGYVGSTKVATVDRNWQTNPDATSVYAVLYTDAPKLDSSLQVAANAVNGNVTGSVASVTGAVGSVTAGVTVTTNNDKTGYSLTAGEHTSITADVWDSARSSHTTAGTFGQGVASVQGNVTGSVGSVAAGGITNTSFGVGAVDATAFAQGAADRVLSSVVEGTVTLKQSTQLANAANAGLVSGAATTAVTIKGMDDATTRISATVDSNGNRTAVTRSYS